MAKEAFWLMVYKVSQNARYESQLTESDPVVKELKQGNPEGFVRWFVAQYGVLELADHGTCGPELRDDLVDTLLRIEILQRVEQCASTTTCSRSSHATCRS